jgi:hypothetical protein
MEMLKEVEVEEEVAGRGRRPFKNNSNQLKMF